MYISHSKQLNKNKINNDTNNNNENIEDYTRC